MSIWSQWSHKCCEGCYTKPQCNSKKIRHQWKNNPIKDRPQGYMRSKKKWGGFIEKGCTVEFAIKTLYLFKHVSELCFIQQKSC